MNPTVQRYLELQLQLDAAGFLTQLNKVNQAMDRFKRNVNSIQGGNFNASLKQTAQGFNNVEQAARKAGGRIRETGVGYVYSVKKDF